MKKKWNSLVTENFNYKLVALFISLILWLTILGRRDFVFSKTIEVDLVTAPGQTVIAQTSDQIKVKVSGPRTALKKFMDSGFSQSMAIDISNRGEGVMEVEIPLNKIEIPMGVKILGVRPSMIRAEVVKNKKDLQE
jgi:YbbR domain-containing protein